VLLGNKILYVNSKKWTPVVVDGLFLHFTWFPGHAQRISKTQNSMNGNGEVFVTKLTPDGSGIVYSYQFWLNKLNQFDGDFRRAEMVKAFITSIEYRVRFALQ
jgi:hypothetical protein